MLKNICKLIVIISIVIFIYSCGSDEISVSQTNYEPMINEMQAVINQKLTENDIGGMTVAFVDGQNTIWLEGFGYADRIDTTLVTPETVFSIGSVSKTMAATLIMTLVEQGLIDLDAPLTDYIPEFSINQRFPNSVITIRSILSHYSGLPGDILTGGFTKTLDKTWSSWLLDYLKDEYTLQPVGGVFGYNNSGFVLLEKVIENVSGMSLEEYSKQYLFAQAGMTTASWFFDTSIQTNIAYPYYAGQQLDREIVNASTAGSVSMNAYDMAKYLKLQLAEGIGQNGTVLTKNSFNQMTQKQYADNPLDLQIDMGLGWILNKEVLDYAGNIMCHSGATIVYNSECIILRDHGLAVFIASNSPQGSAVIAEIAVQILKQALEIKKGLTVPAPQNPTLSQLFYRTENDLEQYNGIYAGGQASYDIITAKDNYLEWTRNIADTLYIDTKILTPLSNGRFTLNDSQTQQVEFANIAGRNVLVFYKWNNSNNFDKYIWAEKFVPTVISDTWINRLGNYALINPSSDDFLNMFGFYQEVELKMQDGLLIFDNYVLDISSDTLAFTSGLTPGLARNRGAAVRIETDINGETIWFLGVPYINTKYNRINKLINEQWNNYSTANNIPSSCGLVLHLSFADKDKFFKTNFNDSITENHHFLAASITKMFTATAIMLLHQSEQLNINDKITDNMPNSNEPYLPAHPDYEIPFKNQITIKNLLNHTAGVFDLLNDAVPSTAPVTYADSNFFEYMIEEYGEEYTFTFDDAIKALVESEIYYFEPNTDWSYSNTGYQILGKIIERVSNKTYSEFLSDSIFIPNNLNSTTSPYLGSDTTLPEPNVQGYLFQDELDNVTNSNYSIYVAEGNIISTSKDMIKFIRNLFATNLILNNENLDLMKDWIELPHAKYGLGIEYRQNIGFGHTGASNGFLTYNFYNENHDVGLCLYSNVWNLSNDWDSLVEQVLFIEQLISDVFDIIEDERLR